MSDELYYAFDRISHVRNIAYSAKLPLAWSLDFNTNPLCAVLVQVANEAVGVLEEMILTDSNNARRLRGVPAPNRKMEFWLSTEYRGLRGRHRQSTPDVSFENRLAARKGVPWPATPIDFGLRTIYSRITL